MHYRKKKAQIARTRRRKDKGIGLTPEQRRAHQVTKQLEKREGSELALELRSLGLNESAQDFGEYTETIGRIGRIFSLISEWIDDPQVDEVLEETYENLRNSLTESTEDFQEQVTPSLNMMKRCLEEIEGN